jgi:hypothetical protein
MNWMLLALVLLDYLIKQGVLSLVILLGFWRGVFPFFRTLLPRLSSFLGFL